MANTYMGPWGHVGSPVHLHAVATTTSNVLFTNSSVPPTNYVWYFLWVNILLVGPTASTIVIADSAGTPQTGLLTTLGTNIPHTLRIAPFKMSSSLQPRIEVVGTNCKAHCTALAYIGEK